MTTQKLGLLLRLAEPRDGTTPSTRHARPQIASYATQIYTALADDDKEPSQLSLYVLDAINPLLETSDLYNADVAANADSQISWLILEFINGREKTASPTSPPSTQHALPIRPLPGSKIVVVGSTPRPDKESDYHEWYNVEHGPALGTVPGWNAGRRYAFRKAYGEAETASFYGVNYYDAESGLGGPIWEKSTKTEWTFRIRGNAAKPNIRRVWRVVEGEDDGDE
ncbi:hypothetical protein IQ06DRAFT_290986 [Phaeosphaeriaceae sp. SRC1lsM3a]|nr:hypothetical protein IQ06DRAFT_290986 [Stagonospora sp. SRC1lsM3a]